MCKSSSKAVAIVAHLKRLNNTQWGSRPDLTRQTAKSCIITTTMHGAGVWRPEETVLSWNRGKLKDLKYRHGQQVAQLSKAIRVGIRTILSAYKTTPLAILHWEAGISPVRLLLQEFRLQQALRLQTLDKSYLLKKRGHGKLLSRVSQTAKLMPTSLHSENLALDKTKNSTKIEMDCSRHDIQIYADGRASGGYIFDHIEMPNFLRLYAKIPHQICHKRHNPYER